VTSSDYVSARTKLLSPLLASGLRSAAYAINSSLRLRYYPISSTFAWTLRPGQYTTGFKRGQDQITHKINYAGNHAKSLRVSVDASLKKLRTSYIDILYLHWWDYGTSVEEVVDSLHTLVLQGKVLYLVRLHLVAVIQISRNFNDLVSLGHFR